jgi:hypothetical protein
MSEEIHQPFPHPPFPRRARIPAHESRRWRLTPELPSGESQFRYKVQHMNDSAQSPRPERPPGFIAVGIFWLFGSVMASLAGLSFVTPGTPLDRLWTLNPAAHQALAPLGQAAGVGFLLLAIALAVTCKRWLARRFSGWWLAVIIVALQVLGDFVNIFLGRVIAGAIGAAIAGLFLFYLSRPQVRTRFNQ